MHKVSEKTLPAPRHHLLIFTRMMMFYVSIHAFKTKMLILYYNTRNIILKFIKQ